MGGGKLDFNALGTRRLIPLRPHGWGKREAEIWEQRGITTRERNTFSKFLFPEKLVRGGGGGGEVVGVRNSMNRGRERGLQSKTMGNQRKKNKGGEERGGVTPSAQ